MRIANLLTAGLALLALAGMARADGWNGRHAPIGAGIDARVELAADESGDARNVRELRHKRQEVREDRREVRGERRERVREDDGEEHFGVG